MGYRLQEPRPPKPRRNVVDLATPMRLFIHNGAIGHFAFPCWYQEVLRPEPAMIHDRRLHDHIGWPDPRHPDHICQAQVQHLGPRELRPPHRRPHHVCRFALEPSKCNHKGGCKSCRHYLDARTVFPIHLGRSNNDVNGEGYTNFYVVIVDHHGEIVPSSVINARAYVDESEDWVVRLDVEPRLEHAINHPEEFRFTIFGYAPEYTTTKVDARSGNTITKVNPARKDVVVIGRMTVMPSAYYDDAI